MVFGFLILLALGVPIYAALFLASTAALMSIDGWRGFEQVAEIVFSRLDTYMFVAIPLFALMAQILVRTDAVADLYRGVEQLTKRFKGSLGIATIGVATVFSSISGSSVATAMTLSDVSIPQMLRHGYSTRAAYGLVAAGGTLGILIPPSIALIIYGMIADVSIAALFIAALAPALLLIAVFSIYTLATQNIASHKNREPDSASVPIDSSHTEAAANYRTSRVLLPLTLPVLIIGGMYQGIFTPSEAGAVGVAGATLLAAICYKQLTISSLNIAAQRATQTSGMVFAIIAGAAVFSHVIVVSEFPGAVLKVVMSWNLDLTTFLIGVMLAIFIMGMFLEGAAIILVTTPIILPLLDQYGIDPVWYGILLVINLEMSLISPPVGLNLIVIKGATRADTMEVITGALPYVALMMLVLLLLIVFPGIALYLPATI